MAVKVEGENYGELFSRVFKFPKDLISHIQKRFINALLRLGKII
jgi:hypothetical protein